MQCCENFLQKAYKKDEDNLVNVDVVEMLFSDEKTKETLTFLVELSQKMIMMFQITIRFYFELRKKPSFSCLSHGGCLLVAFKN